MKNTILFTLAVLIMSASLQAQSTVDSIAAKYKLLPMPGPLTIEKTFPVLGTYLLNSTSESAEPVLVTVTLDSSNKGIIWIEGLTEGRFKAYLKKHRRFTGLSLRNQNLARPIPEGTLLFDGGTGQLQIALGKSYSDEDPTAVFGPTATEATTSKSKTKSKIKIYTAIKSQPETPVVTETGTIQ